MSDAEQLLTIQSDPILPGRPRRASYIGHLVRVLIAPDKFRGTLTAAQASRAIAVGWARSRPDDDLETVPMADGGEGTLEAMVDALSGQTIRRTVTGPLGDPVDAGFGVVEEGGSPAAVIEMARASGLALLDPSRRDPKKTTTYGTGELILAALEHRPSRVILCIGGSATNDGGAGMAQALGARLLDRSGSPVGPGGAQLLRLDRIDIQPLSPLVKGVRFSVASDVDNPLNGPKGASAVYGPQKGATEEDVELLDRALKRLAAVVERDLGLDLRDAPGAGAAGGLGFGSMAFLGAEVRPGVEVVMDAVGLRELMRTADVVITGEGKLDEQSLHGKTPSGVLAGAREAGVRSIVLCGRAEVEPDGTSTYSLVGRFGAERALGDARRALEDLSEEVARSVESGTIQRAR
jgi:glycerate kinase